VYRFNDTFDIHAFSRRFTWAPDYAIASNQRANCTADVAAVNFTVSRLYVGMHAKTADNDAFSGFAKQVVVVVGLLRGRFKTTLVIGVHTALLAFGEFILTQSDWLLVAHDGQNIYDTHNFRSM
jgi:hypothetical protein